MARWPVSPSRRGGQGGGAGSPRQSSGAPEPPRALLTVCFANSLSATPALEDVSDRAAQSPPCLSEGSPAAAENPLL